jgi:hypothetical protein
VFAPNNLGAACPLPFDSFDYFRPAFKAGRTKYFRSKGDLFRTGEAGRIVKNGGYDEKGDLEFGAGKRCLHSPFFGRDVLDCLRAIRLPFFSFSQAAPGQEEVCQKRWLRIGFIGFSLSSNLIYPATL